MASLPEKLYRGFAASIYVWAALGLPLTIKAEFGPEATWTSGSFRASADRSSGKVTVSLTVQVKQDTVDEVRELTARMLAQNVISIKKKCSIYLLD